ncbi:hypothetical protein OsccyDRAFT_1947 [Leptolyngbyaceae cyanobacterium JSC-12]|nr:hypothetical protein OsccyDRAFT_1947 [Leptolyngbyaceae cyanobacterium JSC-12]
MKSLIVNPVNSFTQSVVDLRHQLDASIDQPMEERHTCLCCSYVLLRHIGMRGVYWRCSHCYQTMPV